MVDELQMLLYRQAWKPLNKGGRTIAWKRKSDTVHNFVTEDSSEWILSPFFHLIKQAQRMLVGKLNN